MFIGPFLASGQMGHFFGRRDTVASLSQRYENNPLEFKKAIVSLALANAKTDPGHRHLIRQLLPFVSGPALAHGLQLYADFQAEHTSQRNYLHLGESRCRHVMDWWDQVPVDTIMLVV